VKSRPVFIDAAANGICATIFRADEQLVSRVLPSSRSQKRFPDRLASPGAVAIL
jgi:hypothetical protein